MTGTYIGFLHLDESESQDAYIGAILVTDLSSVPVEFRVTLPVKPNTIQRSLYGDALASYVGVELCGKPLLEAVDHKLELVFVTPGYMLGVRPSSASPVVHIEKTGQIIEMMPVGKTAAPSDNQDRLDLPGGQFQPITLVFAPEFADDLRTIRPLVEQMSSKFDLLEPFGRITRALTVLAQEDPKFAR